MQSQIRAELDLWILLSLELKIPLGELTKRITDAEFQLYGEYFSRNPPLSVRSDFHAALIAHSVMASVGAKTKFEDFLMFSKPQRVAQTDEQMIAQREHWKSTLAEHGKITLKKI